MFRDALLIINSYIKLLTPNRQHSNLKVHLHNVLIDLSANICQWVLAYNIRFYQCVWYKYVYF